ncbi:Histone-binding protein RBBP4 [Babesia duncani]|uniref:Histone-binding protein RBBP4 n=1 Tax=Babesia duncani TaxID=323732 RepID=A0AAD9PLR2_9APIC|nr:Histone-binding protein RBBP4 [Babesia duncani]
MDEQVRNWIINTSVLYEFIACIALPQQPLLHQPLDNVQFQQVACGLQKEEDSDDSIYIIEVGLPKYPLDEKLRRYSQCVDYEGFPLPGGYSEPMFQCVAKMSLPGDVNRYLQNLHVSTM